MGKIELQENVNRESLFRIIRKDFIKNRELYLIVLPVLLFYIVFHYKPMYGAYMAFTDYIPKRGIIGSPFVGFKHFREFFNSMYFWRLMKNTVKISLTSILFGFPAPIILALLINEVRVKWFARSVQTITYLPHFISLVVICGMIKDFTSDSGLIGNLVNLFSGSNNSLLNIPQYFLPIYVISGIWQQVGWGSIIYLAALAGIDQQIYEAAAIDGAGRYRQMIHITIPGIMPTVVILLILRLGSIVSVGFEKVLLLYNPAIYSTADVISTYVYRKGLQEFDYSFSTAVGLFNSVINFFFLYMANWLSRKVNQTSLW